MTDTTETTPGKVYEFITDPGHGWLKVPLADLPLGFNPTMYSFKDTNPGGFAYLEEDCDAPDFINNYADKSNITIKEVHVDYFNRNRERFPDKEGGE